MSTIPKPVFDEAADFISEYGEHIKYTGRHKQYEVYSFIFPEDSETGYPVLYLYDSTKESAFEITGEMALDILSSID